MDLLFMLGRYYKPKRAWQRNPILFQISTQIAFHFVVVFFTCFFNGQVEEYPIRATVTAIGETGTTKEPIAKVL